MIHPSVLSSTVSATPEESTTPQKSETAVNSEPTVEVETPQYNKLTTRAVTPTSITIGTTTLQSGQYLPRGASYVTTTKPDGGYAYYNNGVLTLNGFSYWERSGKDAIYADGDLTITLIGTNGIYIDENFTSSGNCIDVDGNLTINGSGPLTLSSRSYNAITVSGNLNFNQTGTVTVTTNYGAAVYCNGAVTINGNLSVTSVANGMGIFSKNTLTMNSGTVSVSADAAGTYAAIESSAGGVIINGGNLTVNSTYHGIETLNAFSQRGGTVTVTSTAGTGIVVNNATSNAVIYAGTLSVTGNRHGIQAQRFYTYGGHGFIFSDNTAYDSTYCAVKVTDGYVKASHITAKASTTTSGANQTDVVAADLGTYDYIHFYAKIQLSGYAVSDGMYFQFASASPSVSSTKPTSGGYAYYKDNTLTLHNYIGSANANGITHNYDLTIVLDAGTTNSITTSTSDSSCEGIYVQGALTIKGSGSLILYQGAYAVYSTGNLTVDSATLDCRNSGLYAGGNMTLTNAKITVGQLGTLARLKHAIQSAGSISISGSSTSITVNSPNLVNSAIVNGLYGKGITISAGNIQIDASGYGIESTADLTVTGGSILLTGGRNGIYATNMTVSGGAMAVFGATDGIYVNKLNVTSGSIRAYSENTSSDATYCAIKILSAYDTGFVINSKLSAIGNTSPEEQYSTALNINSLRDYDYVRIGDFVMLHDVVLPSGYYMESGNSVKVVSQTMPSSGKYAYYDDGVLTLKNYTYSGSSVAIRTYADTRINLEGGSEINHIISHAGNLVFYGSALHLKANLGTAAINTNGNVFIDGGRITVDSGYEGIYCESFYLRGGLAWVTASYHGIDFKSNFTVSSGAITIKSTNTSGDSSYRAINCRGSNPTISITGMNHMVGKTSSPDILESTNFTGSDYDFAAIGEFIMVRGVILYKGCYLFNGDAQSYQNVGSHTEYAYLKDKNTLELKGYQYSGSAYGIASNIDLTVVLYDEENSIEAKSDYDAIHCNANLTIKGGTNYNDGITVKAANGFGIYAENTFTIDSDNVIVSSSDYPVSVGEFIINKGGRLKATCTYSGSTYTLAALAAGSATINGGRIDLFAATNRGNALEVDNNLVIKGGTVILNSPKGDGIYITDGTMTVQGGDIDITAGENGIYLYNGSYLSVQGGDVTVDAAQNGVWLGAGRLNMNGGFLSLSSTNSTNDNSYRALRLSGTSSDYYNVASGLSQGASTNFTAYSMEKLTPANLSTYDRVVIGDYVVVCGSVVKSGYSANGSGVYSGNMGTGYAYYYNGILTLDQYRNVVSDTRGIQAFNDLTLQVAGDYNSYITVTTEHYATVVYGDLTLIGHQELQLNSLSSPMYVNGDVTLDGLVLTLNANGNSNALYINGDLTVESGSLDAFSVSNTGIYISGNMTVTGGEVLARGDLNGIRLGNGKLTMTGGYLDATSGTGTNDSSYAALKLAGTTGSYYSVSESLSQQASTTSSATGLSDLKPEDLPSYDRVVIGHFIGVNGETIRSGQTIRIGDGSAYYESNSDGETLTLSGVSLSEGRIYTPRSLTLILRGDNSISYNGDNSLYVGGDLKIDGTGSLTATNAHYDVLKCGGNVEINNATVTLSANGKCALYLSNSGTLTVYSGNLIASTQSQSSAVVNGVNNVILGINRGLFGSTNSDGSNLQGVTAADLKNCKYMTIGTCAHEDATTDFDHDCDICGVKNVTAHSYKETVYHNTLHWDICNCGAQIGTASEHTFVSGICACGKTAPNPVIEVPESAEVKQGQPLTVYCSATVPGSPTLSYQWYKSESGTTDDLVPISGTSATLNVDSSTPGTYYLICRVDTSYGGSAYSSPIRLTVIPAVFTTQPVDGEVSHGDSLTVNWATNFTPVKLEIMVFNGDQPTVHTTLSKTATQVTLGASDDGYCVRAYYNSTGYIDSDKFYVTEKAPQITQTDSGATYNVRLIEPWALRVNVRFKDASGNTIPVSELQDYGAYAIRGSLLSSTTNVTIEQLLADPQTIHFAKGTEASGGMFATGDGKAAFHFFDGLYTYRLSEEVYWVAYYKDASGNMYFTKVRNKSLNTLMKDMMTKVPDNEAEVYEWMLEMEESILAYRDGRTGEATVEAAKTVGTCGIEFGTHSGDKYAFGRTYRISLIEPWGIMLNTRIHDTTDADNSSSDHIDYASADNYGVIVYHDKTGRLTGMDDYTDLLALSDAYVYSKDQGNLSIDGTKVSVAYNKDIYTYELNSNIYCVTFVEIDGKYYYSAMTTRNLYELMGQRVEQAGANKNAEIEVYIAMRGMYDSITKYRGGL